MPDESDGIDWSLTTWDGSRREQLRRWSHLTFDEILEAQEEMAELAEDFASAALDDPRSQGLPDIDPCTRERMPGSAVVREEPPGTAVSKPEPWSHQWHDQLSLASHRLMAAKILVRPALLETARSNLDRWLSRAGRAPSRAHLEWRDILASNDLPRILAAMSDSSENGDRLRQSSPFVGILSAEESRALRQQSYEEDATA